MAPSGVSVLGGYFEEQFKSWIQHLLVSSVTNRQSSSPLRQELQLHRFFFFSIAPQCDMEHFGKFWNKILNYFNLPEGSSSGEYRTSTAGGCGIHSDLTPASRRFLLERGSGQPGLGLAGVICGVSWNVGWKHKEGSNYKTEKADSGLRKKESSKKKRAVPQSIGKFECSQINLALLVRAEQITDPKLSTRSYPSHPAPSPTILHTTWLVWFACAV